MNCKSTEAGGLAASENNEATTPWCPDLSSKIHMHYQFLTRRDYSRRLLSQVRKPQCTDVYSGSAKLCHLVGKEIIEFFPFTYQSCFRRQSKILVIESTQFLFSQHLLKIWWGASEAMFGLFASVFILGDFKSEGSLFEFFCKCKANCTTKDITLSKYNSTHFSTQPTIKHEL